MAHYPSAKIGCFVLILFITVVSTDGRSTNTAATPDVVSFHPRGFTGIPKYDRLELGLKLPVGIQSLITTYLKQQAYCQTADCVPITAVNPYDPGSIVVKADFVRGSKTYTRYGFYYEDFKETSLVSSWATGPNPWTLIPTAYTFRIRFAPPTVGNWNYTISVYQNGNQSVGSYSGSFTVVNSTNPGSLVLDSDRLKFADTGKAFFGIGQAIPWADEEYSNSVPADPYTYNQQRSFIQDLSTRGGNFTRIRLDPWSNGVETVEKPVYSNDPAPKLPINCVTNYDHNQRHMWEFDRTLDLCERKGVYVMLSLLQDQFFSPFSVYGSIYYWPNNPYSALVGADPGIPAIFGGVYRFFSDPQATAAYEKTLFYINARWGYSPNIAVWEHINETDNLGAYNLTGGLYNGDTYYRVDPIFVGNVWAWLHAMTSYMNSIGYPNHPQTTGFGTFSPSHVGAFWFLPSDADGLNDCLDLFSGNSYTSAMAVNVGRYSNSANANGGPGYVTTSQMNTKPFVLGEIGAGCEGNKPKLKYAIDFDADVEFHNSVWSSAFSGSVATALNFLDWEQNAGVPHRENFRVLRSFLRTNVNWNQTLYPQNEVSSSYFGVNYAGAATNKAVDNFCLLNKSNGATLAYGWCCNHSHWWATDIKLYNLDQTWTCPGLWSTTVDPSAAYQIDASVSTDPPVTFHHMRANTDFKLTAFETTGNVQTGKATKVGTVTAKSDPNGDLMFRLDFGAGAHIGAPYYSDYAYTVGLLCPSCQ